MLLRSLFFTCVCLASLSCAPLHADAAQIQLYAYAKGPQASDFNQECVLCTSVSDDAGAIAFTRHWKIVYWKNQSYLGRSLIISRRHFGTYEGMTDEEAREYREILKQYLPALQKAFGATHFNLAYLMNMAYRPEKADPPWKEGRPNPHFHWHVIPRYDGTRIFSGETFTDPDFGNPFDMGRKQNLEGKFRDEAIKAIRENLNILYLTNQSEKDI